MTNSSSVTTAKINWKELIVFYAIAVAVSAPFRLNLLVLNDIFPLPFGLGIFYRVLRGIGPAIGYLVVYYLLKSKTPQRLTFFGLNKRNSILAALIIPICLSIAGVESSEGFNEHYYGLLTGCFLLVYAFGEELGWRGYLQEALSPLKLPIRIFVIALLWYIWHLNFLLPDFELKKHLVFFGFLLLGSWGLMKIAESTNSLLFVMAVHLAFNILSDVHMNGNAKVVVVLFAVAIWTLIIVRMSAVKKVEDKN